LARSESNVLVQVHPENGPAAIVISDKLLSQHDDSDSPQAFCQLSCPRPPSCLLRTVAIRVLSGKAVSLGVERLRLYATAVLTDNRCSMMMQLVQVKMNGMLLDVEALSRCVKSMMAMIDDEASFEGTFNDLQQFEEEEQAGRAEQQGADA
jgi:hypothetical protein